MEIQGKDIEIEGRDIEIEGRDIETEKQGNCWDVRQCFVRQFKTDYVRLIEGLVFEKKKIFLVTDKLKKLNFFL